MTFDPFSDLYLIKQEKIIALPEKLSQLPINARNDRIYLGPDESIPRLG